MRKTIYILATLLSVTGSFAQRGPQKMEFNTYIAGTKKIAIAQFTGLMDSSHPLESAYQFKIEQTLKGSFDKTDIFLNHTYGYIHGLNIGDKCVIFITDGNMWMNNQLEYLDLVGKYQHGKTGTDQIIYMEDFYDSTGVRSHWDMENASKKMKRTEPSSLTEGQLKNFMTNGKYQSHIKGYIHFFSSTTQMMEPSALEVKIEIGYTKKNPTYSVVTNFSINDFPALPGMDMFDFGSLGKLVYNPEGTRPLTIDYQLLQADSTGENIAAKFWIEQPEEITEKEFLDYLSHSSYGPPYFEFELETSNHSKYQLIQWDQLRLGTDLVGFMNQTFTLSGMSPPNPEGGQLEMKFGTDEELIIQFKPRPEKKEKYPYIQDQFVREAKIAPIEATITWKKNGTSRDFGACTIRYKKTGFAANPNYRGK